MHHPVRSTPESEQATAIFETFDADLQSGELRHGGLRVPLQRQPFEILKMLLLAQGRLVTRDTLRNALWPDDVHVDFERGLTSAVRKVREALGDSGQSPRFVETLPGRGYRFICPVRFASDCQPQPRIGRLRQSLSVVAVLSGIAAGLALATIADRRVIAIPASTQRAAPAESRARLVRSAVPSAHSAWSAGLELMATGREPELRSAIRWFDRAAALDPGFADAYAAGAEATVELVSRGFAPPARLETAAVLAHRALAADPESVRAQVTTAQLRILDGAIDEAAARLETVIRDEPAYAGAYTALACLRKRQGRLVEASSLAEAALERDPQDPKVVALAGFYAHSAGRYERERELLDRAQAMAPASVDVLWHVALGEARRADYAGALSTLDRALMLAPDAPRLLYWKGFVEAESGRTQEARRTLDTLRQVSQSHATGTDAVASLQGIVEHRGR